MKKTYMFIDGFRQGDIVELDRVENGTYRFTDGSQLYSSELHQIKEIPYNPNNRAGVIDTINKKHEVGGVIDLSAINNDFNNTPSNFDFNPINDKNHLVLTEEEINGKVPENTAQFHIFEPMKKFETLEVDKSKTTFTGVRGVPSPSHSFANQINQKIDEKLLQKEVNNKLIDKILKSSSNAHTISVDVNIPSKESYDVFLSDIENVKELLVERIINNLTTDEFKDRIREEIEKLYNDNSNGKGNTTRGIKGNKKQ